MGFVCGSRRSPQSQQRIHPWFQNDGRGDRRPEIDIPDSKHQTRIKGQPRDSGRDLCLWRIGRADKKEREFDVQRLHLERLPSRIIINRYYLTIIPKHGARKYQLGSVSTDSLWIRHVPVIFQQQQQYKGQLGRQEKVFVVGPCIIQQECHCAQHGGNVGRPRTGISSRSLQFLCSSTNKTTRPGTFAIIIIIIVVVIKHFQTTCC